MARLVQESGLSVGRDLLAATESNIYGHFEEAAFIRFHDEMIARHFPQRAPFCEWLPLVDADVAHTEAERQTARAIWNSHRASGGISWKDPRTSLFLDLWNETLPDARIIVCLRHPYQVHLSLLRRGEPFLHVDYAAAIAGWTVYNQRILRTVAKLPRDRFIVLDVDSAFQNPRELAEGVTRFLGIPAATAASQAIDPEVFNFDGNLPDALGLFESYFPEAAACYRQLRELDFLHPLSRPGPLLSAQSAIQSAPARLIEFEHACGLRAKANKMLTRSIAVDRQRFVALYEKALALGREKDGLIDDLSRLNEQLKQQVRELSRTAEPVPA